MQKKMPVNHLNFPPKNILNQLDLFELLASTRMKNAHCELHNRGKNKNIQKHTPRGKKAPNLKLVARKK